MRELSKSEWIQLLLISVLVTTIFQMAKIIFLAKVFEKY